MTQGVGDESLEGVAGVEGSFVEGADSGEVRNEGGGRDHAERLAQDLGAANTMLVPTQTKRGEARPYLCALVVILVDLLALKVVGKKAGSFARERNSLWGY